MDAELARLRLAPESPPLTAARATAYSDVSLVIPARNEERGLARLLPRLAHYGLGQILVCDNGSTDRTAEVAHAHGATVVPAPRVGYGAACWAGLEALSPQCRVVAFLDADVADDPDRLPALVDPVRAGTFDLVIGTRVARLRRQGSMTAPQQFGNLLATTLIWIGWGKSYADLGPFRAISRAGLARIGMRDRAFGWTVEMQVRAVEEGLRVRQVPVPYYRRVGTSKISGTLRGAALAGYWILRTLGTLALARAVGADDRRKV